jgi:predicted Zn-dependent protease
MKFISKVALAATLATGFTAVNAPAFAQKKDKAEAGAPQLKLSDAVRKPIAAAQTAFAAGDYPTTLAQIAIAEPAAKTDDERYVVNALRLQTVAKTNDRAAMIPALDALIANPKTPATDKPRYAYFRGTLAYEGKKYAEAIPFLTQARDLGYNDPNLPLQIAQAQIEGGNVPAGLAELDKAITAETAAGRKAPDAWYRYGVAKSYAAGQRDATTTWLQKSLTAYPTPDNWRRSILVYREGSEAKGGTKLDRGQQLDLFRLMRATKSLADRGDYLEYGNLAYQAGLPAETKAVIEEGRATGKLPAGDTTSTGLINDSNTALKSEGSLASFETRAKAAPNGKIAAGTADAYLATGNTAKAIELYRLALSKGGVDTNEVNLHLGAALTQAGQKAEAQSAFQAVTAGPRKDVAGFWMQYLQVGSNASAAPAAPAA